MVMIIIATVKHYQQNPRHGKIVGEWTHEILARDLYRKNVDNRSTHLMKRIFYCIIFISNYVCGACD